MLEEESEREGGEERSVRVETLRESDSRQENEADIQKKHSV